MLALVMYVVGGFVAGWVTRGLRRDRRLRAAHDSWQKVVDRLQGKLALERLRMDNQAREKSDAPESAPIFELHGERHLARPRSRTSDSTAARA